ncbi:MAG: cytidine deaminase [Tissierellia bacterium]|nr:cytidine deaminase [Tissierellia bacterium]
MNYNELIKEAFEARKFSYAPYSRFHVGAALLTADGKVYRGCNIESASHTPSCCAERTAFFKAISSGEKDFKAIAIVAAAADTPLDEFEYCAPCGVCRQVMVEFCHLDNFEVILAKSEEDYKIYSLNELLPLSFTGKELL